MAFVIRIDMTVDPLGNFVVSSIKELMAEELVIVLDSISFPAASNSILSPGSMSADFGMDTATLPLTSPSRLSPATTPDLTGVVIAVCVVPVVDSALLAVGVVVEGVVDAEDGVEGVIT